MITKVTSDFFKDLRNPYTGEHMEVYMTVSPGREPLFNCPDTYSTDDFFDTKDECLAAWNRKDGISGLRTGAQIVCAYTGEPLRLTLGFGGKWHFSGGFDPHMFYKRSEFLRFVTMRNGVTSGTAVDDCGRVTAVREKARVTESHRRSVEARAPKLDDAKIHDLENRLNRNGVRMRSGSVSVSKERRRSGK